MSDDDGALWYERFDSCLSKHSLKRRGKKSESVIIYSIPRTGGYEVSASKISTPPTNRKVAPKQSSTANHNVQGQLLQLDFTGVDPKMLQLMQNQNANANMFNDASSFVSFSSYGSEPINQGMMGRTMGGGGGGGGSVGGGSTRGKPSLDIQLGMLIETLAEKELSEQGDALRRFSRNNDTHSLNQFLGLLASVVHPKDIEGGSCANPFCQYKENCIQMTESMKAKDRELAALRAELERVKEQNMEDKQNYETVGLQRQDSEVVMGESDGGDRDGLYLKTTNTSASLNNLFDEESFDNAGPNNFLNLEMSEDAGGFQDVL